MCPKFQLIVCFILTEFNIAIAGSDFPKLTFAKNCAGDIQKAAIVDLAPPKNQLKDFCVELPSSDKDYDTELFNPVIEGGETNRLLLIVRTESKAAKCKLNITMTKKIPKCTDCKGSCAQIKKTTTETKSYEINLEPKKALLRYALRFS